MLSAAGSKVLDTVVQQVHSPDVQTHPVMSTLIAMSRALRNGNPVDA
jgi:hypothetical protein